MRLSIKWNRRAIKQLEEVIAHIEKDSLANAEKVKKDIRILQSKAIIPPLT